MVEWNSYIITYQNSYLLADSIFAQLKWKEDLEDFEMVCDDFRKCSTSHASISQKQHKKELKHRRTIAKKNTIVWNKKVFIGAFYNSFYKMK